MERQQTILQQPTLGTMDIGDAISDCTMKSRSISSENMAQKAEQTVEGPMSIGDAISDFAFKVYRILSNNNAEGNMFLSPYSVSAALMLTMLGCSGESESQLRRGLCLQNIPSANVHKEYRKIHKSLGHKSRDHVTLSVANRAYLALGVKLLESYKSDSLRYYRSETELLDFVGDTEGSRKRINAWVEQQTNNKIKDLIPPGALDPPPPVGLILTNSIYFKGDWARVFEAFKTKKREFHLTASKSEMIDMMHMKDEEWLFGTSDEWDCKMLQLPYKGNRISMMVILPNKIEGLKNVEANLSLGMLTEMRSYMNGNNLEIVVLPKFEMECSFELEKVLPQMGITDIFSPVKANFDRMIEDQSGNIAVSKVIHKAFVGVNEEGTEAAAVTGIYSVGMSLRIWRGPPRMKFIADHPFLFLIQENESGTILFIGRFTQPAPFMKSQEEENCAFSTTKQSSSSPFSEIRKAYSHITNFFSNLRK